MAAPEEKTYRDVHDLTWIWWEVYLLSIPALMQTANHPPRDFRFHCFYEHVFLVYPTERRIILIRNQNFSL